MELVSKNFIIKIAGACNLNCSYCYMYNMGDTSYLGKSKVMDKKVAVATLEKVVKYANRHDLDRIALILHGGEPLLVGKEWVRWFLEQANRFTPSKLTINWGIQTNGTLLDDEWLELFREFKVSCGVSFDGPEKWHDRFRVDHAGRGSYSKVRKAIERLAELGNSAPNWGVLVVANPDHTGVEVYKHLINLGVSNIDFLWPDYHHDLKPPWPPGALASYFNDLFDFWYYSNESKTKIRWFNNAMRLLLSGETALDALGPQPLTELVIETDGSIEPNDALRTCQDHMTRLGLNVLTHEIEDLYQTELFQLCLNNQQLLPDKCMSCDLYDACGAGYMPHRWSKDLGFHNTSVHCVDLYATLKHIRNRIMYDLDKAGVKYS